MLEAFVEVGTILNLAALAEEPALLGDEEAYPKDLGDQVPEGEVQQVLGLDQA